MTHFGLFLFVVLVVTCLVVVMRRRSRRFVDARLPIPSAPKEAFAQARERERYAAMLSQQRAEHLAYYRELLQSEHDEGGHTVHLVRAPRAVAHAGFTIRRDSEDALDLSFNLCGLTELAASALDDVTPDLPFDGGGGAFGGAGASGDWDDD